MISTLLLDAGGTLVMPNFARIADEFAGDGVTVQQEALARAEVQLRMRFDQPDFARVVVALEPGELCSTGSIVGGLEPLEGSRSKDPWLDYMHAIAHGAGAERMPVGAFERLRAYQDSLCLWEQVMPGVDAALEDLRATFRLGVVSNASGTVRASLQRIGLARFFETIVDSFEEGIEKPDPRLFRVALARMGARPDETAYVGDIYRIDVVGARAAGLRAVLLDPHGAHGDKLCERVASLSELGPLLARNPTQRC